jgi:hypothetical protein
MSDRVSFTVQSNVRAVTADVERRAKRALDRIAIKWQADAKVNISPGQPNAAVDTGRLRASIAFSTPNVQAVHSEAYPGGSGGPGGVVSYLPPKPAELTATVGTNVQYGPAIHEGLKGRPRKFIEEPMLALIPTFKRYTEEELTRP